MRRTLLLLMLFLLPLGCVDARRAISRDAAFGPARMRINDTFTRLRDSNGDDKPDQLEANVELIDAFGDATKGAGIMRFDLYDYAPEGTDFVGEPVGSTQTYDLSTGLEQSRYWQSVVRTYRFRLPWQLAGDQRYVLSVVYEPGEAERETLTDEPRRLYDRIVVGGE